MTPITTIFQLSYGLVVAAITALATISGAAQPSIVELPVEAAVESTASTDGNAPSTSTSHPNCQGSDSCAVLDPEILYLEDKSGIEDNEEESFPDIYALTRVSTEPLLIYITSNYGVTVVACWASQLVPSGHPRGPPIC